MRSTPPASSHLAERPVPAAPPPRAPEQGSERADNCDGELGIVDVLLDANELPVAGLAHRAFQRSKQRRVRFRIPERLAGRIERGYAALGQEEANRAIHLVQPLADPAPHAFVLLGRGPHQRDLRIVYVEFALAVALGNSVRRAKID